MPKKISVIIVAAGKGLRMGIDIPKQFLFLSGTVILMRTIERFANTLPGADLFVVLSEEMISYWRDLCQKKEFLIPHTIINGGDTRFESVRNAVMCASDNADIILVHDGVRPFVSEELIKRVVDYTILYKAVVPCVNVVDSLRKIIDVKGNSTHIDRSCYRAVQTPQGFESSLLRKGYMQPYCDDFTDDASVVEHLNQNVTICAGDTENIKITSPLDLMLGEIILREKEKKIEKTL